MARGCLLSLTASVISFSLLYPLGHLFDHMGWPGFNGKAMHAGTWIVAWFLLFGITYCLILAIDSRRIRKSK
jgi:hypothetical protein